MSMLGRTTAVITQTKDRSVTILGWMSLLIAGTGGAFAAPTWIGATIRWIVGLPPWPDTANVLLFIGLLAVVLDILVDGTPNHPAVIAFILAPSIGVAAADGKLAAWVQARGDQLEGSVGGTIADWLGDVSTSALALVCIATALILARRTLSKQRAQAAMGRMR